MAHEEEKNKKICRIGVTESGDMIIKFWIGDGEISLEPSIIGKDYDLNIIELTPGRYAFSIDKKP